MLDQNAQRILEQLLQSLSGTALQQQRADIENRLQETQSTRALREQFSKEAASIDAEAALQAAISQAIRRGQPNINRAAQGAGTSAGSMRALLSQDLATQSAEIGALLKANQQTEYGRIASQLSNTLEALTRTGSGDRMVDQLLQGIRASQQDQTGTGRATAPGIVNPLAQAGAGGAPSQDPLEASRQAARQASLEDALRAALRQQQTQPATGMATGGGGQRGARSGTQLRQILGWGPLGSRQPNQFPPGMQNLGPAGTQQAPQQPYRSPLLNVGGTQPASANRDAAILQAWQQQGGLLNTQALQQILSQPTWEFGGVYNPGART